MFVKDYGYYYSYMIEHLWVSHYALHKLSLKRDNNPAMLSSCIFLGENGEAERDLPKACTCVDVDLIPLPLLPCHHSAQGL